MYRSSRGFTLIELLVVIAIVAILAIVVVLVLNPAQLLMQARDSNRLSDMASINAALNYYLQDQTSPSLGSSNTVYVSIPDPSATSTAGDQCQGLGLPTLPASYSYHCVSPANFRLVNGNGWIPVNFSAISVGSPLGQLPVDPINQSSSRLWYAYATNGMQYETTAVMESSKYQLGGSSDVVTNDGGALASVYEKGTKTGLEPLDYGDTSLVGYWTMDEGTSTWAYDYSGSNATGSWNGTASGTNNTYYVLGKIGAYAGDFNGNNNYIGMGNNTGFNSQNLTYSAWVYPTNITGEHIIMGKELQYKDTINGGQFGLLTSCNGTAWNINTTTGTSTLNTWYNVVLVVNGSNATDQLYVNGQLMYSTSTCGTVTSFNTNNFEIGAHSGASSPFGGYIDDARYYNKVLTAAQIAAIYAGGK